MRTYSKKEKMRQYLFFSLTKLNECVIQDIKCFTILILFLAYGEKN